MMVMLLSVLYMCLVGQPVADYYPFGMVVIVFSMSMLLLPSMRLTVGMSLIVLAMLSIMLTYSQIGREAAYASLYFVSMCCLVLVVGMYFLENTERKQYVYKRDLEKMVSTLRESEQRAMDLYHEAKQAEVAKSEFLAVVSHELRTPMNAIIGFSDIIQTEMMGPVQPVQYKEYATHINKSGVQLLGIINDILDISRADMDKITFESTEFDIFETLGNAIVSCSANAEDAGIAIMRTGLKSGSLAVLGDEARILQALINIIGNAIKFSGEAGVVTVDTAFTAQGAVTLAVTDTGIGISPEDIEQIKQPFQQAEGAFARNNGGLGLGLAICGIVADAHEGELRIESELGVGTTVSLILPPECIANQGQAA
jgi:signal transduction histidine kinase